MLIYQVKITIDAAVEAEWLHWMKSRHVPDVMATGLPVSYQILKPETPAHTYLFHYYFPDREGYEHYQEFHAPELKGHPAKKFPDLFVAERMLLSLI